MNNTPMQELLCQLRKERTENTKTMPIEWKRCFLAIESVIERIYIPDEKKKIENAWQNGFETGNWIANTDAGWNGDGEDYYYETFAHTGEEAAHPQTALEQFIEWVDSDCTPMDCVMKAKGLLKTEKEIIEQMSCRFAEWLTRKESPYAAIYGGSPERWATNDADFTTQQLYKEFLKDNNATEISHMPQM